MILSHNFSLQSSQLRYLKEKVMRLIEGKGELDIESDQRNINELTWLKKIQQDLEIKRPSCLNATRHQRSQWTG